MFVDFLFADGEKIWNVLRAATVALSLLGSGFGMATALPIHVNTASSKALKELVQQRQKQSLPHAWMAVISKTPMIYKTAYVEWA